MLKYTKFWDTSLPATRG